MAPPVSFKCSLSRTPAAIVVTYTITNDRAHDLGVFNKLRSIAVDGALDFSPDNVYVDLEGETLRFLKEALPIPPGLKMAAYLPPYAALLRKGASLTETFVVPIPIAVRHPFKRALISGEVIPVEPRIARRLEVEIGVFSLVGCHLAPEHPAFPEAMTVVPPDPAVTGQELLSAAFSLTPEVAVLDYKGFPWS
ncbi:MAG: hypothetical protein ABI193_09375 [Minicystis sp.]